MINRRVLGLAYKIVGTLHIGRYRQVGSIFNERIRKFGNGDTK